MNSDLLRRYRYFRRHGERAVNAWSYARAEMWAWDHDIEAVWDWDDIDVRDITDPEIEGEAFYKETHEVMWCRVEFDGYSDSLGGIIDPDTYYTRFIEAELLTEVYRRWSQDEEHNQRVQRLYDDLAA